MTQGQLLRQVRYKNDLSQAELAEICGYDTAQFISNIERDVAGIPLTMAKIMVKKKLVDGSLLKSTMLKDYKNFLEREL